MPGICSQLNVSSWRFRAFGEGDRMTLSGHSLRKFPVRPPSRTRRRSLRPRGLGKGGKLWDSFIRPGTCPANPGSKARNSGKVAFELGPKQSDMVESTVVIHWGENSSNI